MPSYSTGMGHLSDDQFAGAVNAGGASRMLHTHEAIEVGPQNVGVHSVSLRGHEQKYAAPVVRQQVAVHAQQMLADPTLRSDSQVMQGGWKEDGEHYLDASRKVVGREKAVAEGRKNQQLAVFDFGTGQTVYTRRSSTKTGSNERLSGRGPTGYVKKPKPIIGARSAVDNVATRRRR